MDQLNEVKGCYIKSLAGQRYPKEVSSPIAAPQSSCDWAVLAYAYARDNKVISQEAKSAFSQAVSQNAGFALVEPLFYTYFDKVPIVEPPTFGENQIKSLQIKYQWGGLGDPVYYTADIHDTDTTPVITIRPKEASESLPSKIDKSLIQALIPALSDLIPVSSEFTISPCFDNYPGWQVVIILTDNTKITATTSSNFIGFGGPWFAYIDGQEYFQPSASFPKAVGKLVSSLHLPPGQPSAMMCGGGDENIFEWAFPKITTATQNRTLVPSPSPIVTPTSIFRLTHLPPSETISGTFGSKPKDDNYYTIYSIVRFFDDGTVTYQQIILGWLQDIKEWPAVAYSSTEQNTNACQGNYYLKAGQIEFSLICPQHVYKVLGETHDERIDMTGTYDGKKLTLDSYYYPSGYNTSQKNFLPIDDPSLKP